MARVTLQDLRKRAELLGDKLKALGCTEDLHLEMWSPGDGRTRYSLESNGYSVFGLYRTYWTRQEINALLEGALWALEQVEKQEANQ